MNNVRIEQYWGTRILFCGRAFIKYTKNRKGWIIENYRIGMIDGPVGKLP